MTERPTQDVTYDDLANWFTHHPPQDHITAQTYGVIRDAGHEFAKEVVAFVPAGAERDEAIKAIRNAVMWANAGIACNPAGTGPRPLVEVLADAARGVDVVDDGRFPVLGCPGCHFLASKNWFGAGMVTFALEARSHLRVMHGWTTAEDWEKHGVDAWAEENCP